MRWRMRGEGVVHAPLRVLLCDEARIATDGGGRNGEGRCPLGSLGHIGVHLLKDHFPLFSCNHAFPTTAVVAHCADEALLSIQLLLTREFVYESTLRFLTPFLL
jgi:hypothetical protein